MHPKYADEPMQSHPDFIVEEEEEQADVAVPKPSSTSSKAAFPTALVPVRVHPRRVVTVVDRTFRVQETVLVRVVQSLIRAEAAARSSSRVAVVASRNFSDEANVLADSRGEVECLLVSLGTAE